MPNSSPRAVEPSLQASWTVHRDRLEVTYRLSNPAGSGAIFAFDGATGEVGVAVPDLTEQVYVSFEPPETVHVKRVCSPLPRAGAIALVRTPALSRLEPGGVREIGFSLAAPVRERAEYFPEWPAAPFRKRRARSLALWLGYLHEGPDVEVDLFNPDRGIYVLRGSVHEQLFLMVTGAVDVDVLVREDGIFERV
jgi:hypothetical protein